MLVKRTPSKARTHLSNTTIESETVYSMDVHGIYLQIYCNIQVQSNTQTILNDNTIAPDSLIRQGVLTSEAMALTYFSSNILASKLESLHFNSCVIYHMYRRWLWCFVHGGKLILYCDTWFRQMRYTFQVWQFTSFYWDSGCEASLWIHAHKLAFDIEWHLYISRWTSPLKGRWNLVVMVCVLPQLVNYLPPNF